MDACSLPLPYEYSKYLFMSSFLMGASSLMCLYYKDYVTFLFLFLLFLSSIQFWRKPEIGWRRSIDLWMCKLVALYLYGNTMFCDEYTRTVYLNGFYSMVFLFFMSHLYYYFKQKQWIIFHMTIHLYTFFTPVVLYML